MNIKSLIEMNFGEHVTIDGYNGDKKLLINKEIVFSCLNDLPEVLGMRKFSQPEIYWIPGNNKKDPGGWSGVVLINESHISIHNFPDRQFLTADVYTCKNGMDATFIENYFKQKFALNDIETNFIKRGTRYPVSDLN